MSLVLVATRHGDSGAVLCTDAVPASAAQLRCRFPNGVDVPAARCEAGVCCTPPETREAAAPFAVWADETLLAEGLYDPKAAPARGRRSGLKPFAIMCVERRAAAQRPRCRNATDTLPRCRVPRCRVPRRRATLRALR